MGAADSLIHSLITQKENGSEKRAKGRRRRKVRQKQQHQQKRSQTAILTWGHFAITATVGGIAVAFSNVAFAMPTASFRSARVCQAWMNGA